MIINADGKNSIAEKLCFFIKTPCRCKKPATIYGCVRAWRFTENEKNENLY